MHVEGHTTSEAEEMYLITVARAIEDGELPPVSVSTVAKTLDVSSVSANQMVKKLAGLGLLEYTPYKGVSLTDEGAELANVVLRNRRLWGVFLVDHLGLSPRRADEVACEMEHVTPAEVADRLSDFLGDPVTGPQGKAIPARGRSSQEHGRSLGEAHVGSQVVVAAVPASLGEFLEAQGLGIGSEATVSAIGADGSIVLIAAEGPVHVSRDMADQIGVSG